MTPQIYLRIWMVSSRTCPFPISSVLLVSNTWLYFPPCLHLFLWEGCLLFEVPFQEHFTIESCAWMLEVPYPLHLLVFFDMLWSFYVKNLIRIYLNFLPGILQLLLWPPLNLLLILLTIHQVDLNELVPVMMSDKFEYHNICFLAFVVSPLDPQLTLSFLDDLVQIQEGSLSYFGSLVVFLMFIRRASFRS